MNLFLPNQYPENVFGSELICEVVDQQYFFYFSRRVADPANRGDKQNSKTLKYFRAKIQEN